MRRRTLSYIWALLIIILSFGATVLAQGDDWLLRVTSLDISEFPWVRLTLISADSESGPLADLAGLSLRENGIPIGDLTLANVTVGVDVIFILDANDSYDEVDDASGLSRQEKAAESIRRYALRYMGDEDRVTIVVPDGDGAKLLIDQEGRPAAVVDAVAGYAPETLSPTPLNEMLLLALAHAADRYDLGRFQAVLLFSDGAELSRQLSFSTLVEQARRIDLPFFTAILGQRADPNEIENVARLYEPTRAAYVHLQDPNGADPIYAIWGRQRSQLQISYRSLQSSSGTYPVTVSLGPARATTSYDLAFAPPEVFIKMEGELIRRIGQSPEAPLDSLDPVTVPMPFAIQWPDGHPRQLISASMWVNDQPHGQALPVQLNDLGEGTVAWDIRLLDAGTYMLHLQVTDEMGLIAAADPVPVTIAIERPAPPPTPVVVPTAAPEPEPASDLLSSLLVDWRRPAAAAAVVAAVTLLLAALRRRRGVVAPEEERNFQAQWPADAATAPEEPAQPAAYTAFLEEIVDETGERLLFPLLGENVAIGRDRRVSNIVLEDTTVGYLHARIKKRGDGYWLYDEGSDSGTFRNYQRLGLTPQPLEYGDKIHFGRIGFRFVLRLAAEGNRADSADEYGEYDDE